MRLQRNWTSAVTLRNVINGADITLQPGNVIDVSQAQYQGLKDIYGTSFVDVGNDTTLQMVVKSFTTAEIKALNTTPRQAIPAPGAWYAIALEKVISSYKYVSAAYATNTDLEVHYDNATAWDAWGAEATMDSLDAILLLTADAVYTTPGLGASADTALTINKGITAKVASGNPATGSWTLKLRIYYRIVSVS